MITEKLDRRGFLLSASLLSTGAFGFAQGNQDFSQVQIKVTHVSGGIYMLQGQGGNIAASVGDDGIAIVDDQFAPLAEKIRAAVKGITGTDKPVRFVINTHYHGDHTGGNPNFSETSTIIAQDNVRKRLATGGPAGNGASVHMENQPAPKAALPIITFEHDVHRTPQRRGYPRPSLSCRPHRRGLSDLLSTVERCPHGRRLRPLRLPVHRYR
jgi:cyclase